MGPQKVSKSWAFFWKVRCFNCKTQTWCPLFALCYHSSIVWIPLCYEIRQESTEKSISRSKHIVLYFCPSPTNSISPYNIPDMNITFYANSRWRHPATSSDFFGQSTFSYWGIGNTETASNVGRGLVVAIKSELITFKGLLLFSNERVWLNNVLV